MRILQLIDSLDAGGAERMAVSYANALSEVVPFSALVTTRKEGNLKLQLSNKTGYLFLNKKHALDFGAVFRLRKFVIQHKIEFVHSHSTSFFLAVLLKIIHPKIKIIWHDHYGNSEFLEDRSSVVLKFCSRFFRGIVSVNNNLKQWAENKLHCDKVACFPNFVFFEDEIERQTILNGENDKRIVCLANLRKQKNHELLIQIAKKLKGIHLDWTFHFVGKDFEDDYSRGIKTRIRELNLEKNVFIYGSRNDIENILNQSDIAVLTSNSEGLPVALLEYGYCKKAVVVTNVGDIPKVVKDTKHGILVNSGNVDEFVTALCSLIENPEKRKRLGEHLQQTIYAHYSREAVVNAYLSWLNK